MKQSLSIIFFLFIFSPIALAQKITTNPEDQTDLVFHEGSVLVSCGAKNPNETVSTDLFNQAFPKLVPALHDFIKQEKLIRAHYLGELKAGVFLVVGGSDRNVAMENAQEIVAKTTEILKESTQLVEVDANFQLNESCTYTEIGPLFLQ